MFLKLTKEFNFTIIFYNIDIFFGHIIENKSTTINMKFQRSNKTNEHHRH